MLVSGYSQPDYGDGYKYEDYAIVIGILIGLLPIFALMGGAIWQILSVEGNITQVRCLVSFFFVSCFDFDLL